MYELDNSNYFYLLICLPIVLGTYLYWSYWRKKTQKKFADAHLLQQLSPNLSTTKPLVKMLLYLLILMAMVIGLVNPQIGTKMETIKREGIDIVFAVDVSKSMLAEDIAPNRINKAKQIVSKIVDQLEADRIGIIAYAGSAFPILPITTDYNVAKMFLKSINTDMVSSQGTAINQAIDLAATYFDDEDQTNRLLVIISDGEDHSEEAENAAQKAKELGMKIVSIGVGTTKGGRIPIKERGVIKNYLRNKNDEVVVTKMNPTVLQSLATITDGQFIKGENTKKVTETFDELLNDIEKSEFETQQISGFQSQFQWFIGLAFLLLLMDVFILERKTEWLKKLNLFNE